MKNRITPLINRVTPTSKLLAAEARFLNYDDIMQWYLTQCEEYNITSTHQKRVLAALAYQKAQKFYLLLDLECMDDKHMKNAAIYLRDNLGLLEQIPKTTKVRYVGDKK